jgi:hypothetical protein
MIDGFGERRTHPYLDALKLHTFVEADTSRLNK